jgi:hypothetical protein
MLKTQRAVATMVAILASMVSVPSFASIISINFDTDKNGIATFDNQLLNSAYAYSEFSFGADDVVKAGFGGVTSQPNFATGSANNFNSVLDVFFTNIGNSISASNVTNSSFTLSAYDINNNLLGSVSVNSFTQVASLTFVGQIKRAQFTTTFQYGIDDLVLDVGSNQVIPEPSSLLVFGGLMLGMSGLRIRSRRS